MVLVLFGTQTGNSELLAGEIAETLRRSGRSARVVDMADAYPEMLLEQEHLIVALCTWNDGTFPDNAVTFWDDLTAVEPDCSHLSFAIVGLGDTLYEPDYQVAAYRLADRLEELGARRAMEMFEIDGPVRRSHRRRLKRWVKECATAFDTGAPAVSNSPRAGTSDR